MEFTIHQQVLTIVFVVALIMGAIANKTNFCTMGAVSDWVNMGDTGRLRAWLFAIAVAILGVAALTGLGLASIGNSTFPPYRTPNFAWLRYLLGGLMFGVGMTLASGCGNKTLLRIGAVIGLALAAFAFVSKDFRGSFDNVLAGLTIGLAVVIGWYVTGGSMGTAWKEWAEMADVVPSRVEVQSFTFISPMGDSVRYLMDPANFANINFGITALTGVIVGSFLYALLSGNFRIEWFASGGDFLSHAIGAVLMGIGGVLSMGCTIGQGITGVSTLAMGSFLTLFAIVAGAAATMKFQYWRMMQEA